VPNENGRNEPKSIRLLSGSLAPAQTAAASDSSALFRRHLPVGRLRHGRLLHDRRLDHFPLRTQSFRIRRLFRLLAITGRLAVQRFLLTIELFHPLLFHLLLFHPLLTIELFLKADGFLFHTPLLLLTLPFQQILLPAARSLRLPADGFPLQTFLFGFLLPFQIKLPAALFFLPAGAFPLQTLFFGPLLPFQFLLLALQLKAPIGRAFPWLIYAASRSQR
jgi:hypothetical protein